MKSFFYKNWVLFYILFFLLLGLLVYALFWKQQGRVVNNSHQIIKLEKALEDCKASNINKSDKNKPLDKEIVHCNSTVKSGGQGISSTIHDLGDMSGEVIVQYDMFDIPDKITVTIDNKIVASTQNLVSGVGSLSFYYNSSNNSSKYCLIEVSAPGAQTSWKYKINCPN